ncbi:MAG: tetratricopeptide repeat protein, partial [Candidatus Latescibacteria bacterium]|nr:tetratricopeptide repeat protein [Candidatus Latescibacterota bacterium]
LAMDGLYGQAIDHYRRAVAGHRDFAGAWFNMGLVYEKMHQSENALAAYAKAVQLDPAYAPQVAARRRAMGHGP